VLATKEDFRSRKHFLHMRDCVNGLLDNGIVPILNENDTISISDVMFSDNDELAGLTAAMIDAEKLVILTSIAGLFNKNPSSADAKLIKEVKPQDDFRQYISKEKSSLGRGGMGNKCQIARRIASLGIETWIVNGKSREIITKSDQGKALGTRFLPEKKTTAVRKWLAVSKGTEKGDVEVNKGAYEGILRGGSILFVGIVKVIGEFQKGDLVRLVNSEGEDFGLAVAAFSSKKSQELIGQKDHKPFARRDFIFLY
jgi:glutamate 5-kinase